MKDVNWVALGDVRKLLSACALAGKVEWSVLSVTQSVPIAFLRCDDRPVHVKEGFGGQPIEAWPVFEIMKRYVEGDKKTALGMYQKWYQDQLEKYANVRKRYGGMYRGSLFRLIKNEHLKLGLAFNGKKMFAEADEDIISSCIRIQANGRLSLIDSIARDGYLPQKDKPIAAVRRKGLFYLVEGHHRTAALKALGYETIEHVKVVPNHLYYQFWSRLGLMRKGLSPL